MKISRKRNDQLVVSYQVVADSCCGLSVTFCSLISHLIGRKTINIPKIFSGVPGFMGKTVKLIQSRFVRAPSNDWTSSKFKNRSPLKNSSDIDIDLFIRVANCQFDNCWPALTDMT